MSEHRGRGTVRIWLRALAALALCAVLVPPMAVAAAEDLQVVQKLALNPPKDADPNYGSNGTLVMNPAKRRAYQLFVLGSLETFIRAYDLDTLKVVKEAKLPFLASPARTAGLSGEFIHGLDVETNTLYVPYITGGLFGGIVVIDLDNLRLAKRFAAADAPASPVTTTDCAASTSVNCVPYPVGAAPTIAGLTFSSAYVMGGRAKLQMLLGEPVPPGMERNVNVVWVAQWDALTGKQDFLYRVTACQNFNLPNAGIPHYQAAIYQSPNGAGLYVGCNAPGGAGQAVRLLPDSSGRPTAELAYPGPLNVADIIADPIADRLIFRTSSEEGEAYWVFDARSAAYVGVIGATLSQASTAAGIDPETGRLYILAPRTSGGKQNNAGGILIVDARRSPVPQALQYESFSSSGQLAIRVDPELDGRPRRFFVKQDRKDHILVVRDRLPISEDPDLSDQDRFTTDTQEEAGKTTVNFTGTAHAYGIRALFVGGLEGVPPPGADILSTRPGKAAPAWAGSPCGRPDREIVVGGVKQAALSNDLASAKSMAIDADAGTQTDEQQPVGRCWPRPVPNGVELPAYVDAPPQADQIFGQAHVALFEPKDGKVQWPWPTSECSGDQSVTNETRPVPSQTKDYASFFPQYRSSSTCNQSKTSVAASSTTQFLKFDPLTVADVSSSTYLARDAARGLIVRSEAVAKGIELKDTGGNVIFSIEAARSVAESFAAGRAGTAGTTYVRELCGVRVNVGPSPVNISGCVVPDSAISPTLIAQFGEPPLIQAINRALGSRGRVTLPEPDDQLKQGTPGGYLASIQKDRLEQVSANAVNNDPSTQVPALEIVLFNDDPTAGRGRQVYQLAGVDASTTYGINVLDTLLGESGDAGELPLTDLLVDATGGANGASMLDGAAFADTSGAPTETAPGFLGAAPLVGAARDIVKAAAYYIRNPRDAALAGTVWFLLLFPVYLAARRRLLAKEAV